MWRRSWALPRSERSFRWRRVPGVLRSQKNGEATQVIVYDPTAIGRACLVAPLMDPIGGNMCVAAFIGIARKSGEGMFAFDELGAELAR